jgi:mRNA interferase MazF
MVISQGEVHWVDFGRPKGSEPGYRRPCVIVQNNAFNASRIATVVVVVITSNLKLGQAFGNVTLPKGEAGLRRKSVVNISQIATVDRSMLDGRIGTLSRTRFNGVLQGIYALLKPLDI